MDAAPHVHRMAAFTDDPAGGNPAGVVITPEPLDEATMQRLAADVGYSETAFLHPVGPEAFGVRYFAPRAEVPFCGHATIAAGVVLGERSGPGTYHLTTATGPIDVEVTSDESGPVATLTSVAPAVDDAAPDLLAAALEHLGLDRAELDPRFPPAVSFAGASHLLLVLRTRDRLARLDYAFDPLRELMERHGLTTVALLWREHPSRWHARNAFPVGGVVEDPATGAAAAALGGYLRVHGHLVPPAALDVLQGEDLGRPSHLRVFVDDVAGGIRVAGRAVPID